MATIREELIEAIAPKDSVRQENNLSPTENHNRWLVRDNELVALRAILTGVEFGDVFYNVENELYLRWDKKSDCFWDIEANEAYMITVFRDDFSDLVQSALDWTFANSGISINDWIFGTHGIVEGYTNAMFISAGAGFNIYTPQAGISHAYVNVDVPAGSVVRVKSLIRSNGFHGFHQTKIFAYNAPFVPTGDINNATTAEQALIVGEIAHEWLEFTLPASFTGGTITLVYQWKGDALAVFGDPPGHLQELIVQFK